MSNRLPQRRIHGVAAASRLGVLGPLAGYEEDPSLEDLESFAHRSRVLSQGFGV
ncbi:hypothetical protein PC116_g34695 [Phytophthora cactorum]|nr:hypothetical protein PC116_g34695 [Phytophthora cactorum]